MEKNSVITVTTEQVELKEGLFYSTTLDWPAEDMSVQGYGRRLATSRVMAGLSFVSEWRKRRKSEPLAR